MSFDFGRKDLSETVPNASTFDTSINLVSLNMPNEASGKDPDYSLGLKLSTFAGAGGALADVAGTYKQYGLIENARHVATGVADAALLSLTDKWLSSQFQDKRMRSILEPNGFESFLAGCAGAEHNWRFKALGTAGAWLTGRIANFAMYELDQYHSNRS